MSRLRESRDRRASCNTFDAQPRLIDEGKVDKAKRSLQAALNTLVVTDHVVPLPALRAEALLERTEAPAEKSDQSDEESDELSNKLAAARDQLKVAELLGYGEKNGL